MTWLFVALALIVGGGAGFAFYKLLASSRVQTAEGRAQKLVLDAEREAQTKVQQALAEVKRRTSVPGATRSSGKRNDWLAKTTASTRSRPSSTAGSRTSASGTGTWSASGDSSRRPRSASSATSKPWPA